MLRVGSTRSMRSRDTIPDVPLRAVAVRPIATANSAGECLALPARMCGLEPMSDPVVTRHDVRIATASASECSAASSANAPRMPWYASAGITGQSGSSPSLT